MDVTAQAVVNTAFNNRGCPHCGSLAVMTSPIQSDPPAERLSIEQILAQWNTDFFNTKAFFSYFRCSECGMLYCPIYPTREQLQQLYGSMAPNMADLPEASLRRTQQGYLRAVLRHRPPPGDVIEVGPDRGFLAAAMSLYPEFERFWFTEPNVPVHSDLRASVAPKECHITTDFNRFDHIPDGSSGMAFMVHVLDHLTDPVHHLSELHRCLKPNGLLSIVVHNERSFLARISGPGHPIYSPQHPQLFNPATLRLILKKAGFSVVDVVRTRNYYPLGFLLQNALHRIGLRGQWIPQLPWAILPMPLGNIQAIARK